MAPSAASKLILLADQAQVSLEERNRLLGLNLAPSREDDSAIENSLKTMLEGITALHQEQYKGENDQSSGNNRYELKWTNAGANQGQNSTKVIGDLVSKYNQLLDMYQKDPSVDIEHLTYHPPKNDEESMVDSSRLNKSVRFKDNLEEHEPQQQQSAKNGRQLGGGKKAGAKHDAEYEQARQELFVTPYRDEPEEENLDGMSNQQLYQDQQQTMRTQDEHLDRLASSVSRQRELSMQIEDEITHHNSLLDDVDGFVDSSSSRLAGAKRQLDHFSRKAKQNGSWVTIAILILIFIILIVVLK